jgi:glycine cleavage system H protein
MSAMYDVLQGAGILAVGLLARLGLFIMLLAALAVPALVLIVAWRAARDLWHRRLGMRHEGRVDFRPDVTHTPGHTWLQSRGDGRLRLGVDDVARRLFTTPQRVVLPRTGVHVRAGQVVADVITAGRPAAIVAPLDGIVRHVNGVLDTAPGLLRDDPYYDGWLVEMEPDPGTPPPRAMADTGAWLNRELGRLTRLVEQELGMAAADGGEPSRPPVEALTDEQWGRVAAGLLARPGITPLDPARPGPAGRSLPR